MALLIVGTEKTFAALRPRLFEGRVSTKAAGEVAEAIKAANPHADLDKLSPGTVLTIPDLPTVRLRGELSLNEATHSAIEGLGEAGRTVLEELTSTATGRERESAAERKKLVRALETRELAAAMREDPPLKADVEAARVAVQAEEAAAEDRAVALRKAQSEWSTELAVLEAQLK